MGTPDFAVPSLNTLLENNYEVVAVITAPDKPAGRGNKIQQSAVKEFANSKKLNILQPENLKNETFIDTLRGLKADLQIVVAFRMLPEIIWNMPPKGTVNLHASLLPQYRGAAPINWAIINGERETGLTTFFIEHQIDTGKLIFQEKQEIEDVDDFGSLYSKLMSKGADLVLQTVKAIEIGDFPQIPQQDKADLKSAPKLSREVGEINWGKPAQEIHNLVRGLCPTPTAWTFFQNKNCKIYKTSVVKDFVKENMSIGDFYTDNKKILYFKSCDYWVSIDEIQIEGKKRMTIKSFLAGNKIQ